MYTFFNSDGTLNLNFFPNIAYQLKYQSQLEPLTMIRARSVLKGALEAQSNHPGALHYLIHAYDVALVNSAEQARDYADSYGKMITTSSHAQHAPAHIWMRLGKMCLFLIFSLSHNLELIRLVESCCIS